MRNRAAQWDSIRHYKRYLSCRYEMNVKLKIEMYREVAL